MGWLALMQDETLALQIVQAVVDACQPHVLTLKMRAPVDADHRTPYAGAGV
jgi:tRNA-dihydrouridine synthase